MSPHWTNIVHRTMSLHILLFVNECSMFRSVDASMNIRSHFCSEKCLLCERTFVFIKAVLCDVTALATRLLSIYCDSTEGLSLSK